MIYKIYQYTNLFLSSRSIKIRKQMIKKVFISDYHLQNKIRRKCLEGNVGSSFNSLEREVEEKEKEKEEEKKGEGKGKKKGKGRREKEEGRGENNKYR